MNDAPATDQALKVGGNAAGIVQLAGSHNTVTVVISGEAQRSETPPPGPGPIGPNPYRSLLAFDEASHALFFGRNAQTEALLRRTRDLLRAEPGTPRLLGILGPSGSGKSSIARAGLIPAIARSDDPALHAARIAVLRPGAKPVQALAAVLARVLTNDPAPVLKTQEFEEVIRRGSAAGTQDGLSRIAAALPEPHRPLILLIDQFEETYTLTRPADPKDTAAQERARAERDAFIGTLWQAATEPHGRVLVVLTMRIDFFGAFDAHRAFGDAVSRQSVVIGPMLEEGLREAIGRPAALRGFPLPGPVIDSLVDQARENPGALPLVQHALHLFWKRLEAAEDDAGRAAALAVLRDIGPAMAREADARMAALDESARALAWRVFISSVQLGEGVTDTKRRVRLREVLPAGADEAALRRAVEPFVEERLLSLGAEPDAPDDAWVEISHEALILHWTALRDRFTPETREAQRLAQRAQEAAERWQAGKGEPWRGIDLALLRRLAREHRLTAVQARFLDASARRERRQRWMARGAVALLAIAALGAVGVAWVIQDKNDALALLTLQLKRQIDLAEQQRDIAEQALDRATRERERAAAEAERAQRAADEATEQRDRALRTQVLRLAKEAEEATEAGDAQTGLLLALEALDAAGTRFPDAVTGPASQAAAMALARNREVAVLRGHAGVVFAVAYAPDGRLLASAGEDGTLRLWDATTFAAIGEPLRGHDGSIVSVAFAPSGDRFASGGADGTIRLWDAATRQPVGEPLRGHSGGVWSVAFSPEGERLASAGGDGMVRLWDAATGAAIGEPMRGHSVLVRSVTFSPRDDRLASASFDGTVRLWDTATLASVGEPMRAHGGQVFAVAFLPSADRLVSAGLDGTLRFWDAAAGTPIGAPMRGHGGSVGAVAVSPRGDRLASSGCDGTVRLWDPTTFAPVGEPIRGHDLCVASVAFSPQGDRVASAGIDGTVRVWTVGLPGAVGVAIRGHEGEVSSVAYAQDGDRLASAGADGTVRLWSPATGAPIGAPLRGHEGPALSVTFVSRGGRFASGGADGTVRFWDAAAMRAIGEFLRGDRAAVLSVAYAAQTDLLASAGADGTIRLSDAAAGRRVVSIVGAHEGAIFRVAFSGQGDRLASAGADGTVRLWDAASGAPIGEPLGGHEGWAMSVALSPRGDRLASADYSGTVRLWDVETRTLLGEAPRAHQLLGVGLAFSPDGQRLASSGIDGMVRLWHADALTPSGPALRGHTGPVTAVAFSPRGDQLASAGGDGTIRLWSLHASPADLMRAASAALVRCLSAKQRVAYALAEATGEEDKAPAAPPPPCWPVASGAQRD